MFAKRLIPILLLCGLLTAGTAAQEQTYLNLQTATPQLQTGQEYPIDIRIDNVPSLWLASVEVVYDPKMVYIIGTKSGSPVRPGGWFDPQSSVVVFNQVEQPRVRYTISLTAPAQPVSGSGVIGTFRVYPLKAGTTTLQFRQAELLTTGDQGNAQRVDFVPVLLDLTLSGDTVEPPPEATATPEPTATTMFVPNATQPPQPTALANVTLAPGALQPPSSSQDETSPVLAVAIGAMVIGGIGLILLLVIWRRSRR